MIKFFKSGFYVYSIKVGNIILISKNKFLDNLYWNKNMQNDNFVWFFLKYDSWDIFGEAQMFFRFLMKNIFHKYNIWYCTLYV